MYRVANTGTPKGVFVAGAIKHWLQGEVKTVDLSEADLLEVRGTDGLIAEAVEAVPAVEVAKPAKAQKANT